MAVLPKDVEINLTYDGELEINVIDTNNNNVTLGSFELKVNNVTIASENSTFTSWDSLNIENLSLVDDILVYTGVLEDGDEIVFHYNGGNNSFSEESFGSSSASLVIDISIPVVSNYDAYLFIDNTFQKLTDDVEDYSSLENRISILETQLLDLEEDLTT